MVSTSIAMTESTHVKQCEGTPHLLAPKLAEKLVDLQALPQSTLSRKQDPLPFCVVARYVALRLLHSLYIRFIANNGF